MSRQTVRTYQASDLHTRYRDVLDAARAGHARLRDKDGTSLLVVPEGLAESWRALATAGANLAAAVLALDALRAGRDVTPQSFGNWTWLRSLDVEDLAAFVQDVSRALHLSVHEDRPELLDQELRDWRATAAAAADPVYVSILAGGFNEDDFVEAQPPASSDRVTSAAVRGAS